MSTKWTRVERHARLTHVAQRCPIFIRTIHILYFPVSQRVGAHIREIKRGHVGKIVLGATFSVPYDATRLSREFVVPCPGDIYERHSAQLKISRPRDTCLRKTHARCVLQCQVKPIRYQRRQPSYLRECVFSQSGLLPQLSHVISPWLLPLALDSCRPPRRRSEFEIRHSISFFAQRKLSFFAPRPASTRHRQACCILILYFLGGGARSRHARNHTTAPYLSPKPILHVRKKPPRQRGAAVSPECAHDARVYREPRTRKSSLTGFHPHTKLQVNALHKR